MAAAIGIVGDVAPKTRHEHGKSLPDEMDRATRGLAQLAARQHGVVTAAQLAAAGLRRDAIDYRLRVGRLHRIHAGVYCLEYVPKSAHARLMAAVLACGRGAVLSHMSAAALFGITAAVDGPIEVSARHTRHRPGLLVHRSRHLGSDHTTSYLNIPVTTVARTIVDITPRLDDHALARVVNNARLARGITLEQLERVLASLPKREGSIRLRALTDLGGAPTRSALEDRFLALIKKTDLPRPEINQHLAAYEVDALWRDARLVVELDGRRFHSTARDFERDRIKDADLVLAGYRVLRITWQRLRDHPGAELARLRHLLAEHDK